MLHTSGPLTPHDGSCRIVDDTGRLLACAEWAYVDVEEAQANARLLAAAYTSYDRHCGPRAIECAEDDLLGELLAACKKARDTLSTYEWEDEATHAIMDTVGELCSAIARVEGSE